ncbi:hypothetical protein BD779DRAFT_1544769, partial [Infundibulicybe gibba]
EFQIKDVITSQPGSAQLVSCVLPTHNRMSLAVVRATEYLSAFSLALTVWDHAITLDSEALYIWSRSKLPFIAKAAYVSNRYIIDAIFCFTAYYLSGTHTISTTRCKTFMWTFLLSNCIVIAITQTIVAWEIFNLWERRKTVARLLIFISIIYIPVLFVLAVECMTMDTKFLINSDVSMVCSFAEFKNWRLPTAFGLITGSDLIITSLVLLNAMARPRKTNHDLIFALHRDGAAMYAAVLAIRILALILAITFNSSTSFVLLPPTAAISAIVNSRLMIRVAKLQEHTGCEPSSLWASLKRLRP